MSLASSLVEAWKSAFLSSCKGVANLGRELVLFLEVQQGSQTSIRVVRGYSGFHSSRCRGTGPHLKMRGQTQVSSPLATGILWFLSSFNM